MLPKTIAWTLTAVPSRPVILLSWRYLTARSVFQEPKTALISTTS